MTKDQLKHLALLPKVIEALRVLAAETEEAGRLMARVGVSLPVAQMQPRPEPTPPNIVPYIGGMPPTVQQSLAWQEAQRAAGSTRVVLQTPERMEYEASLRPPKPAPKQHSELPAAQRKAIENGYLKQIEGERAEKLEQFKHDSPEAEAAEG